ncbi:universal stress protein UspA [Burkholderia sp. SRS-W-2-2016]|uniref:universal stress protein n=1 Tax=Burkholderia sp. SRS-W-2-2016 TaxID=1926878 RepID=UPI00094B270B|nr:universal stress protein [Burkholderia sp. SRS-W-2-2016]OLL31129.1 universal stress protein UspA [Burkholderia sp. SRS-W-2-2016]
MNSPLSASPTSTLPTKVLVALDRSTASQHALAYASRLVAPGGAIRLVSIAENPRTLVPAGSLVRSVLDAARDELLRDAHDALAAGVETLSGCDASVDTTAIDLAKSGGDVVHALLDAARAWQADLIVTGAHQHHGLLRWVEGTVSAPLARFAPCPILIVPAAADAQERPSLQRILFAVDGSEQASAALRYGVRFATPDTSLRAIYVVDRAERLSGLSARALSVTTLEDAFANEGVRVLGAARPVLTDASGGAGTELVLTERSGDDVAHAIVREAARWQADMIVMGTHGRRGVTRWLLGSVAERVARLTPVPLLLVQAS